MPTPHAPSPLQAKKKKGSGSPSKSSGKGSKKKSSKKGGGSKEKKPPADPLAPAAMLNAYYISHGAVEFLTFRGYKWEGAAAGKKKKKK